MQYEIKEEKIDGNTATVTAEIIVKDYTKIINEAELYKQENIQEFYENNSYSENKYRKYLLEQLKKSKDKITYTIEGIEYSSDLIANHSVEKFDFKKVFLQITLALLTIFILSKILKSNKKKSKKRKYGPKKSNTKKRTNYKKYNDSIYKF